VKADCLGVYRAIGEVEAAAHGCTIDEVHFHEVGAVDTIVDVVCACLGTHLLGVERLHCNGLELGSGTVRAEHGILPVPAPATAALLRGIPARIGGRRGERTTPTGAALLRELVDHFDEPLALTATAIGYGAGTRDDAEVPNLLRVTLGEAAAAPTSPTELVELQCHVDTATGEQLGWLLDEALARGAVDAFATGVTMKKGRPGVLLTLLADDARAGPLTTFLLEEASTLGVRRQRVQRTVLERWHETRATAFGPVRFKLARLPSGVVVARPEDDELRRLGREQGLGRAELLRRLQG
jgi:pyridinium-3,5-bisthiocarboxylic acid mononucleotide nickel chelatase